MEGENNIIKEIANNDNKIISMDTNKKQDVKTIIFYSKDIKDNCIQIEGFSFRLLDKEIKSTITIDYVKNNGIVEIIKMK